jgi:L-ascorbate metabolism protein UlaG (beta-lactamase superfamily)
MLIGGPTPLLCVALHRGRLGVHGKATTSALKNRLLAFAGIALAQGKVDLILVAHGHGDHLGDAMELAKANDVPMWAPAGLNQTLLTLGLMPAKLVPRMGKGGTIEPSRRRAERAPGPARRLDDARKTCKARP